jgi:hypothetical protein
VNILAVRQACLALVVLVRARSQILVVTGVPPRVALGLAHFDVAVAVSHQCDEPMAVA